jgi:TolB protein
VIDVGQALERESERFHQAPGARERLHRRRDRKRRNHRIGAAILGISISVATVGALFLGYRSVGVPVQNPPVGQNGRIVFARAVSDAGEDFVTFTANPDGSDERQLPGGASFQPKPRWSRDGREIAIAEPKATTAECPASLICAAIVVNVDTGAYYGVPWLMPGTWDVDCFLWSPDGTRLACSAVDDNGTNLSGIYAIRASDGGDPRRIAPCNECVPGGFSPDGSRIVFSIVDPDGTHGRGIYVVRLNGGGLHRLTPKGMILNAIDGGSWSPRDQIVFQARRGPDQNWSIWVVNADGSGLREILIPGCGGSTSDPDTAACRLPVWSPDGTKVLFSRARTRASVAGLYSVNADGSGLVQVTSNGFGDYQPDWGPHL